MNEPFAAPFDDPSWPWTRVPLYDAVLDELELIYEKRDFVQQVRTSLEQDLHECPDEIRATAFTS